MYVPKFNGCLVMATRRHTQALEISNHIKRVLGNQIRETRGNAETCVKLLTIVSTLRYSSVIYPPPNLRLVVCTVKDQV